ncbi:hypothetical protein [Palaeococcus sp. (in: euryarchaeotes)]
MKKVLGLLVIFGVVSQLFGLAGAYSAGDSIGPWNVQQVYPSDYYDGDHWLGKFVAISGTKDPIIHWWGNTYAIYVTKSVRDPTPISGLTRVSSFAVKEGDQWRTCSWWIFCTTYWPDIRVKAYEEYYYYGYPFGVEYSDATVITDKGSDKYYVDLEYAFRALLDAAASMAGSPIGVSWIFDVFKTSEDSGPVQGMMTDHMKINLKTGEQWFPYPDEFYADHGLIQAHINVHLGNVFGKRNPGDTDVVDLDSIYTVEAGEYYIGPFMDYPAYGSVTTRKEPLYLINIVIKWTE